MTFFRKKAGHKGKQFKKKGTQMSSKKGKKQTLKNQLAERSRVKKANKLMSTYNRWLTQGDSLKNEIRQYTKETKLVKQDKERWHTIADHLFQSIKQGQRLKQSLKKSKAINQTLLKNPMKEMDQPVQKKKNWFETLFFYSIIVFVLMIVSTLLTDSTESGVPRNIGGYAPFTVLTKSMDSVYPKDSFLLTKIVDPNQLKIGDDITFLKENNTIVTHRIVGIEENYQQTGQRGFETKGVDNPVPDKDIVIADNVIGQVIYSNLWIGKTMLIIRKNLLLTAVLMVLSIFFIDALVTLIKSYR